MCVIMCVCVIKCDYVCVCVLLAQYYVRRLFVPVGFSTDCVYVRVCSSFKISLAHERKLLIRDGVLVNKAAMTA